MATIGSTTSPFGHFYGEKPKIIASFPEFGLIEYVTKREKFRKQITDKTFKEIMVGYAENHTGDTYELTNPETKRVVMTRDMKWADWNITDLEDILEVFR